jgi:peptide/nickel transport system substrate-binding protein
MRSVGFARFTSGALRRLTALALVAAAAVAAPAHAQRDQLTIAYPVDVQSWDPTSVTFPAGQSIYKSVFDSPLHYSPDLKLQPRIVREWKFQDKEAKRLEVTLRDDVFFHDGSKLTTEDLKFSFAERPAQDKKLAIGGMMSGLTNVEIISPTRAVIVYSKPTPAAPIYLAFLSGYILPKAYFTKVGPEGFAAKPIGAGPYRVVDYQRGSRIVLEAFDKYWGGAPAIKKVTFEIVPEAAARVAAIESGRADVATQLPLREVTRLNTKGTLIGKAYPYAEVYMMQIPSYVEAFKDDNLRRAMHLAIDKAALSKAFYGSVANPLHVIAPANTPGYVPDFTMPFDRKAAQAALAKSGFSPAKPAKIKLLTTNGTFPNDYELARAIAGMWKQVGIEAEIEELTVAKYLELNHSAKLPGVMLYSWANATGDPENYTGRILDPNLRFSAWKSEEAGKQVHALLVETDPEKRMAGYRKLNREASEKTWTLPLLQGVASIVYKADVEVKLYEPGYVLPAEYKRK